MDPKHPADSKMIWLGIAQVVLSLLVGVPEMVALVQKMLEQPPQWSDVGQVVPWVLMLVCGVATIALRAVTKQPLALK